MLEQGRIRQMPLYVAMLSFAIGAGLGSCFRVLVLLPASLALGLAIWLAQGAHLASLVETFVCLAALQVGYLASSMGCVLLERTRRSGRDVARLESDAMVPDRSLNRLPDAHAVGSVGAPPQVG